MQKTILITGCSSGIGLCAALRLQKKGYRVFATARKDTDVEKLRAQGLADSLALDINDSSSIQQGLNTVLNKTSGTLDALFNNAGFAIPGAVEDLSRDMMRAQFETNVFGAMELTNLVIPIMRKQGHGRIIQNTSILGVVAIPYRGAYNASKFALEGFTNTLRQELSDTPIHVSIIAPGPITSQFRANALQQYHQTLDHKNSVHAERYQKMAKIFAAPTTDAEKKITLPPDAVVDKLIHALESPHPKTRYYIGMTAHAFAWLRRILPDCGLDWIIHVLTSPGE
jgi:short-subunit dehydrogenase